MSPRPAVRSAWDPAPCGGRPSASSCRQGVPQDHAGLPLLPQRSSSEDFIRKHRF